MRPVTLETAVFIVLLILVAVLGRDIFLGWRGGVGIHVLDIGQGDCILITSPSGKQIVVDGGPDLGALGALGMMLPLTDRTIELLILSHPDLDHVASLAEVVRRYNVERVLLTGLSGGSPAYQLFLDRIEKLNIPLILADPSKDIDMGDGLVLDVVWPRAGLIGTHSDEANNTSVTVRALYRDHSILLTGDIEEKAEAGILASGVDIKSDVLKSGHHGSKTSSSTGFLLAVDPALALISAGRDNDFGHPHQVVLDRYTHFGIPFRVTSWEGQLDLHWR